MNNVNKDTPDANKKQPRPDAGFRRRIIALGVLLGLLLLIFLLRLVQFQLIDGEAYRRRAEGTASSSAATFVPSEPPQVQTAS